MMGWPVNVPLKIDRPTGFGVGVTVELPMTISGTGFLELASRFKSNPRLLGKISGVSGDRKVICDLEMVVKRKR